MYYVTVEILSAFATVDKCTVWNRKSGYIINLRYTITKLNFTKKYEPNIRGIGTTWELLILIDGATFIVRGMSPSSKIFYISIARLFFFFRIPTGHYSTIFVLASFQPLIQEYKKKLSYH